MDWKGRALAKLEAAFNAFCEGGVIAAGAIALPMATDGLNMPEVKILGGVFLAGGLAGVRMLFKTPPRDPNARTRESDKE